MQSSSNIGINITILCRHLQLISDCLTFNFIYFHQITVPPQRIDILYVYLIDHKILFTQCLRQISRVVFWISYFQSIHFSSQCYNTWINHFHNLNVSLKKFLHFMCKLKMQPGTLTFCQNLFTVLSGRQRGITLHFNGYKPFTIKF